MAEFSLTFGFVAERTLTFTAFAKDGSLRGSAGQSLPEQETNFYAANPEEDLQAGDTVIVFDSEWGAVSFGIEKPDVNTAEINEQIAELIVQQQKQMTVYDERPPEPVIPRVIGL